MINPKFPFKDNQIILSSDRIVLHSKTDAIFLFGKGAVSLSSPNTINLDANEKVVAYSPRIELGNSPNFLEPTIKGRTFLLQLSLFFETLEKVGETLEKGVSHTNLASSMSNIVSSGVKLKNASNRLKNLCQVFEEDNSVLSKNVYVS